MIMLIWVAMVMVTINDDAPPSDLDGHNSGDGGNATKLRVMPPAIAAF